MNEADDLLDRWLRMPHTKQITDDARLEADKSLGLLLRSCESSSDPNVRAAKGRYDGLLRLILVLEKGESMINGMDDTSLEAKVARVLGKGGEKLQALSSQAQRVAVQDELMEEKKRARVSPPGTLPGMTPLLEKRRLEFSIIDSMFDAECMYDRVYVYQIPPKGVVKRQQEAREKASVITMSVGWKETEQDKAHRGVVVSAGLSALDYLTAHGVGLGHIVNFALFSPLRHFPDDELPDESLVVLHAGQGVSSEDTKEMLRNGQLKLVRKNVDGQCRHVYQLEDGTIWLPEIPWMPPEY